MSRGERVGWRVLFAGVWLLVFAVVVGQAVIILWAHLPWIASLLVYLVSLAVDIVALSLGWVYWTRKR